MTIRLCLGNEIVKNPSDFLKKNWVFVFCTVHLGLGKEIVKNRYTGAVPYSCSWSKIPNISPCPKNLFYINSNYQNVPTYLFFKKSITMPDYRFKYTLNWIFFKHRGQYYSHFLSTYKKLSYWPWYLKKISLMCI